MHKTKKKEKNDYSPKSADPLTGIFKRSIISRIKET
jgi:hypothetical protein